MLSWFALVNLVRAVGLLEAVPSVVLEYWPSVSSVRKEEGALLLTASLETVFAS